MNLNEREIISFLAMTMYEKRFQIKFKHTLEFLNKHISPTQTILDLGVENPFQESWKEGFSVTNTSGEDLDKNQLVFSSEKQDVVTAFEIFEHLKIYILTEIKSDKLFISIPLRLWFSCL
jgi:hypothetical protein